MSLNICWLPDIVRFEEFGGNWEAYLVALYDYFKVDFVDSKPVFEGKRLGLKRHPVYEGKEATFWHMIQDGLVERERTLDLRRCERIRWPKPVIENSNEGMVKVWKNKRKGEVRICLWLEAKEYLVVLAERKGYLLPWTAYLVVRPNRKRKLQREYQQYIESTAKNS